MSQQPTEENTTAYLTVPTSSGRDQCLSDHTSSPIMNKNNSNSSYVPRFSGLAASSPGFTSLTQQIMAETQSSATQIFA